MNHASEAEHQAEHQAEQHQASADVLSLDNGNKWLLDEPTRLHVGNMEKALQDPAGSSADMKYYITLSDFLKENIGKLTADCSMTGQSHEELHKWLIPYIEKTKEFSAAKNPEEAAAALSNLQESMNEFHRYFE